MLKDKLKGFITGVVVTSMIFTLSVTAFAASGSKTIQAAYDNIKVYIDQKLTPMVTDGQTVEPFTYQGRTYVPLNALASALGQKVSWDDTTKSIYIGTQPAEQTADYSRNNPAPLDTAQKITVNSYSQKYTATVAVNNVVRGSDAWIQVRNENQFNKPASDGYEYILAQITVTADYVSDDGALNINSGSFTAYSSGNAEYDPAYVVCPNPELSGKAYSGGTQTGYLVFQVKKDDDAPKIVFGADYKGKGGIWFKLYK